MNVAYSCQVPLGHGFGLVAQHAVDALKEKGYLHQLHVPRARTQCRGYDEWHDTYVSLHLGSDIDVFCGWANTSLDCIKRTKIIGAKSVIHRGSAHIKFQEEVLAGEGIRLDPANVERQVQEYELADHIIVDSAYIRETFQSFSPHLIDKVHVVNLGVDIEKFTFKPPREDKFVVLFVGGNTSRKGLKYLQEAWINLKLENAELRVIGFPITDIETVVHLKNQITYLNHVSDIAEEYHNASVICLPSIEDGWGMVVTEAAACGLPHIISENTGCKDIFSDLETGIFVPVRDIGAISYWLEWLYYHPGNMKDMGYAARKAVEQNTWKKYQENFLKVIEC